MRKVIILFGLFGLLAAMQLMAEDKSIITVKSGEVSNGVVILTVHQAANGQAAESFALHCNKGMASNLKSLLETGQVLLSEKPL